jgi:hypothetical protein
VFSVRNQKEGPSDPAEAFYEVLNELLKASRQGIQEAFEPVEKRVMRRTASYSQGIDADRRLRTDE